MGITPPNQPTEPTTPPSAGQTPPAEGAPSPPTNGQGETPPDTQPPQNWDEYLEAQPAYVRELFNSEVERLQNTVHATRNERDTAQKQLKELGKKLEEGSEARQQLDQIVANLEAESARADFYEEAAQKGVANLKLAWLAVQEDKDNLTRRGRPDFDALKERHPQLFRSTTPVTPPGHAGAGTQTPPSKPDDMDTFIRRSAGIIR
jgi:TolA-binding protein